MCDRKLDPGIPRVVNLCQLLQSSQSFLCRLWPRHHSLPTKVSGVHDTGALAMERADLRVVVGQLAVSSCVEALRSYLVQFMFAVVPVLYLFIVTWGLCCLSL